jgi:hypothetical protein
MSENAVEILEKAAEIKERYKKKEKRKESIRI